jgi:hypothetical protein
MKLFVDDIRIPPDQTWIVARSSGEALKMCSALWPTELALDHDLGGEDTIMNFLKGLYEMWDGERAIPAWSVHSGNPVGKKNIVAYMESWEKSSRKE